MNELLGFWTSFFFLFHNGFFRWVPHCSKHPTRYATVQCLIAQSVATTETNPPFDSTVHDLAHLVRSATLCSACGIGGLQLVVDCNVKVSAVLVVGAAGQRAVNLFALLTGENILEVEHCLLPVGVLGVRAGGESNGLVACGELDVEPRHKRVDEVVASSSQVELYVVSQVGGGALVQVKNQNTGGVGHNSLHLDSVDERLRQGGLLERGVVETVDIVPDCSD